MGKSICMFQAVKIADPKLQNSDTIDSCMRILDFLRLVTQVILPKDNLCWLVFNGRYFNYFHVNEVVFQLFQSFILIKYSGGRGYSISIPYILVAVALNLFCQLP